MKQIDFEKINNKNIDKGNHKIVSITTKEKSVKVHKKQNINSKVINNNINCDIKVKNKKNIPPKNKNTIEHKRYNSNNLYRCSSRTTYDKNNEYQKETYNDVYDILNNFRFDSEVDGKKFQSIDMSYKDAITKINNYINSINKIVSQYINLYKKGKGLFSRLADRIFNRVDEDKEYILSGVAHLPKVVDLMKKIEKLVIYVDINYFKDLTDYVEKKLGALAEYYPTYY